MSSALFGQVLCRSAALGVATYEPKQKNTETESKSHLSILAGTKRDSLTNGK